MLWLRHRHGLFSISIRLPSLCNCQPGIIQHCLESPKRQQANELTTFVAFLMAFSSRLFLLGLSAEAPCMLAGAQQGCSEALLAASSAALPATARSGVDKQQLIGRVGLGPSACCIKRVNGLCRAVPAAVCTGRKAVVLRCIWAVLLVHSGTSAATVCTSEAVALCAAEL